MLDFSANLAASEDGVGKLIGVAVFIAIWALGALASALGKKKEKERQEQLRLEVEKAQRTAPNWGTIATEPAPPMPPPPREHFPVPVPPSRRQQTPQVPPANRAPRPPKPPKPPKQRKQRRPDPPPVPVRAQPPEAPEGESSTRRLVTADVPQPRATPAQPVVSAADLAAWLRPRTLRQQFILTELLQPPLAMRPPDPNRG